MVRKHPKSAFKCPKKALFGLFNWLFGAIFLGGGQNGIFRTLKGTSWNFRISGSVWGRDDRKSKAIARMTSLAAYAMMSCGHLPLVVFLVFLAMLSEALLTAAAVDPKGLGRASSEAPPLLPRPSLVPFFRYGKGTQTQTFWSGYFPVG